MNKAFLVHPAHQRPESNDPVCAQLGFPLLRTLEATFRQRDRHPCPA